jgi:DNA-binding transcriptional MerR regulator
MPNSFRSGQLAKAAAISSDSLRFYERRGLLPLPPRTESGYRAYPPSALDRVLLIRRALSLGLSIDELVRLLRVRESGGAPCRNARTLLAQKIDQLDTRLKELKMLRKTLRATLRDWDARLARTPPGVRAGLLEAVPPNARRLRVGQNGFARPKHIEGRES